MIAFSVASPCYVRTADYSRGGSSSSQLPKRKVRKKKAPSAEGVTDSPDRPAAAAKEATAAAASAEAEAAGPRSGEVSDGGAADGRVKRGQTEGREETVKAGAATWSPVGGRETSVVPAQSQSALLALVLAAVLTAAYLLFKYLTSEPPVDPGEL